MFSLFSVSAAATAATAADRQNWKWEQHDELSAVSCHWRSSGSPVNAKEGDRLEKSDMDQTAPSYYAQFVVAESTVVHYYCCCLVVLQWLKSRSLNWLMHWPSYKKKNTTTASVVDADSDAEFAVSAEGPLLQQHSNHQQIVRWCFDRLIDFTRSLKPRVARCRH